MLAHKSCMSGALRFCQGIPRIQDTWYRSQMTFPSSPWRLHTPINCGFTVPCPAPPGGFDTLSRGPTYLTDPTQIPGLEQKTLSHFLDLSARSARRSLDPHAINLADIQPSQSYPKAPEAVHQLPWVAKTTLSWLFQPTGPRERLGPTLRKASSAQPFRRG